MLEERLQHEEAQPLDARTGQGPGLRLQQHAAVAAGASGVAAEAVGGRQLPQAVPWQWFPEADSDEEVAEAEEAAKMPIQAQSARRIPPAQ